MITFDTIRERYPHLGLALYAIDPGGPVTLEVVGPGDQLWTFTARTESAVLALAFPIDTEPDQIDPAPEPPAAPPAYDLFD